MQEIGNHPSSVTTVARKRLGALLQEAGVITEEPLRKALEEQTRSGKRLGELLTAMGSLSEVKLAQILAMQWGHPFLDLNKTALDPAAVRALAEPLARRYKAVPVRLENRVLTIAISNPLDYQMVQDLAFLTGFKVTIAIATPQDILEAIDRHYSHDFTVQELVQESFGQTALARRASEGEARSLEEQSRRAPVIRLVDLIVMKAARLRASDIHIEPARDHFRIRYRLDGLLKEEMRLPRWLHPAAISRIKVLAQLDIAERRLPQDGAIRYRLDQRELDLRVSIIPTLYGEKVVVRILDQEQTDVSLDRLGLLDENFYRARSLLERKQGILLVTGPTGSGKTTTLYAMIKALRSESCNIVAIEDPIEYHLEGINQIQIHPEIGLTFAASLRAILRQDPNVILVGEIRDLETAEMAMRAAMSGHLVLSTLHTKNAPSTITRLTNLGIPRYLVASTLAGVIAQRLVRRICARCKTSDPTPAQKKVSAMPLKGLEGGPFYRGAGCPSCHFLGYSGRVGLFEVLKLTPALCESITAGASEAKLRSAAIQAGMRTLWEDGLKKIQAGITTPEELLRVVERDEGINRKDQPLSCQ